MGENGLETQVTAYHTVLSFWKTQKKEEKICCSFQDASCQESMTCDPRGKSCRALLDCRAWGDGAMGGVDGRARRGSLDTLLPPPQVQSAALGPPPCTQMCSSVP